MPCFHPSNVPIRRKYAGEELRNHSYFQMVPCGNCLGCRLEQGRQWAVRMMHETQMHDASWFLTLTYSDRSLPDNGSLFPRHFTGFIKNLRREYWYKRISYFGCGEYGEDRGRPHYHAVVYGPDFSDKYIDDSIDRARVWRSDTLDRLWRWRGRAEIGSVTHASARYVSGYVRKKIDAKDEVPVNRLTGEILEPVFANMSLRPALGKRWIEKFWRDVYPRDYVVTQGKEAKPPRYYDKWMALPDEKGGTAERRAIIEAVKDARYEAAVELEKPKLRAMEKIATARTNLFGARNKT